MFNWLAKNFWLKMTALALAVITWFYADVEIRRTPGESGMPFSAGYAAENMIKQVQIVPIITGQTADGYTLFRDRIIVRPNAAFIIGPKHIVEKVTSLRTVEIDITGQSRPYAITVPLEAVKGVRLYGAAGVVDVAIPIEKSQ